MLCFTTKFIPAEQYYCNAGLVITRSGRNTLSELAYLGIPAISFVSGCSYRKIEQTNNINDFEYFYNCSRKVMILVQ